MHLRVCQMEVRIPFAQADFSLVRRVGCPGNARFIDDLLHTFHPKFPWLWCFQISSIKREQLFSSDDLVLTLDYTADPHPGKPPCSPSSSLSS